jgi:hypothetical protein
MATCGAWKSARSRHRIVLRPHLKMAKWINVAGRLRSVNGICVSTIGEAARLTLKYPAVGMY